jgi:hypothetical protein
VDATRRGLGSPRLAADATLSAAPLRTVESTASIASASASFGDGTAGGVSTSDCASAASLERPSWRRAVRGFPRRATAVVAPDSFGLRETNRDPLSLGYLGADFRSCLSETHKSLFTFARDSDTAIS